MRSLLKRLSPFPLYLWNVRANSTTNTNLNSNPNPNTAQTNVALGTRDLLIMTRVSTDDLQPALRTTLQLLDDLSIYSPEASTQVQGASTQQPRASAQMNCWLKELKGLVAEKDLELGRCGAGLPL